MHFLTILLLYAGSRVSGATAFGRECALRGRCRVVRKPAALEAAAERGLVVDEPRDLGDPGLSLTAPRHRRDDGSRLRRVLRRT